MGQQPALFGVSRQPEGDEVPNYHTTVTLTADQVRELVLAAYPESDLSGDPSGWFSDLTLTASAGWRR